MKMHLMTFDEAYKTLSEAYPMSAYLTNKSLLGIRRKSIPWGKKVEVDINTLSNGHIPTYTLNGFLVPACVFKADDENLDDDESLDKESIANDILRYGTILTDDELWDETDACIRIKIVSYEQAVYYIKMVNGEVVELSSGFCFVQWPKGATYSNGALSCPYSFLEKVTDEKVTEPWVPAIKDNVKVGSKVRMIDGELHNEKPQWFPVVGTVGIVRNLCDINCDVQWPKGTTSWQDKWWCSYEHLEVLLCE